MTPPDGQAPTQEEVEAYRADLSGPTRVRLTLELVVYQPSHPEHAEALRKVLHGVGHCQERAIAGLLPEIAATVAAGVKDPPAHGTMVCLLRQETKIEAVTQEEYEGTVSTTRVHAEARRKEGMRLDILGTLARSRAGRGREGLH
jgi:hypothetical protein